MKRYAIYRKTANSRLYGIIRKQYARYGRVDTFDPYHRRENRERIARRSWKLISTAQRQYLRNHKIRCELIAAAKWDPWFPRVQTPMWTNHDPKENP